MVKILLNVSNRSIKIKKPTLVDEINARDADKLGTFITICVVKLPEKGSTVMLNITN